MMHCFLLTAALFGGVADAETPPPNIVIIFVDDMGWGDLPSQGATGWEMPNLARMEREGSRFTHFSVAQPVCSASRAALLTGCYPNRLGIHGALGPSNTHGIHDDETTLAELARSRGYRTGMFGKWHLGYQPQFLPTRHGFDEYFGIPYSNDMWPGHPESPKAWPPLPLIKGEATIEEITTLQQQGTLTRRITEHAVDFIERHADEPFLLYVPHPQPHVPLAHDPRFAGTSAQGMYGDVMHELDWSVGEILGALDAAKVTNNTMVIFASDNGPWSSYGDHAGGTGGLREGKGTTFEGGVRVPCVVRWPSQVPAGMVNATPWRSIDLFPTVARAMDVDLPAQAIDGVDATAILAGVQTASTQPTLYYYRTNELQAIRSGRWKMHVPHGYRSLEGRPGGTGGIPVRYRYAVPQSLALFDLETDPSESVDVKDEHPEVLQRLLAVAEAARADLGDALTERAGVGLREPGRVDPPTTP
jgi:arylsulfatase A